MRQPVDGLLVGVRSAHQRALRRPFRFRHLTPSQKDAGCLSFLAGDRMTEEARQDGQADMTLMLATCRRLSLGWWTALWTELRRLWFDTAVGITRSASVLMAV